MSGRTPLAAEVARFLRQRAELQGGELVLDGVDRAEALSMARAGRSVAGDSGPDAPGRTVEEPASGTLRSTDSPDPETSLASFLKAEVEARSRSDAEPEVDQGATDPELPDDYDALRELALGCTRCRLSETRNQVVFADGSPDARLMVVGEAPGANEDASGLPFVGQAGRFLDLLLACVGLSREESVYIANVLKCRPPGNRDPQADEIECCSPFLRKQIELVQPEVILAVGTFAGKLLTGTSSTLGRLRGEVYSYEGVPLLVTYHPAALLRNGRWTRPVWDDLQLLRSVLDGG